MATAPTTGGGVGAILAAGERDYLVRNSGEQVSPLSSFPLSHPASLRFRD
jgi:nucleoredoxin